ncbi:MAG: TatD family hydrolase, partial [Candidatus Diapherotrites archaeon]|nr:TatD family hydrolase [Candidatus Diapherotrites archaeon]
ASVGFASSVENRNLAAKYKSVFFLAGVSPQRTSLETENEIKPILEMMRKHGDRAVGFGEIGLDYSITQDEALKWQQRSIFRHFLAYAEALDMPIAVHSRGAVEGVLNILEKYELDNVLLHWFEGTKDELIRAIRKKYYISVGPKVINSKSLNELVMNIPLEKLVLETDGPVQFSGKPAEPSWIPQVGEAIAQILGQKTSDVEAQTYENTIKLYNLEKKCELQ